MSNRRLGNVMHRKGAFPDDPANFSEAIFACIVCRQGEARRKARPDDRKHERAEMILVIA